MNDSTAPLDLVVVGGGPAGTYTAWRAMTGSTTPGSPLPADPAQRRVLLLESSGRIGGRLDSIAAPGTQGLMAEFGGMGFTDADRIFSALVRKVFGIPNQPFATGSNLVYLRGVRLQATDLDKPASLPYRLLPTEQARVKGITISGQQLSGPTALVAWAADRLIPGCLAFTTHQQWEDAIARVTIDGLPLRDIGFWNFLLKHLSNEAFGFVHDADGHYFQVANWNCAEAVPWYFLEGPPYYTLDTGYDTLPKTLAAAFAKAGGRLALNAPVGSVTAPTAGAGLLVNPVQGPGVATRRVVLALPRRALQMIAPGSVVLDTAAMQQRIRAVTGQRVMKLFLTFATPWWTQLDPPIRSGSSSTDLPLGQCWYFTAPDGGDSLLMAAYNDTLATTYWEGLAFGPRFPTQAPNPPSQWTALAPSQAMVAEVLRQLEMVHGVPVPQPTGAAWRDWSRDPFGGAFHTWNVGVDVPAVEEAMLMPDPAVPLHICGDAYSSDQGWTEGAFATAERVVQRHLGIAAPPWL